MLAPSSPIHVPAGEAVDVLPAALAAGAAAHPSTPLTFRDPTGVWQVSLAEIHERALRVATGLAAIGVRAGDVVAVQLPGGLPTAVAHAAVLLRGAVLLPLLSTTGAAETRFALQRSGASALITTAWRSHDALRGRRASDGPSPLRRVIAVSGTWPAAGVPSDAVDWAALEAFRPLRPDAVVRPDDPGVLVRTHGAGGAKGVVHTHRSVLSEVATLHTRVWRGSSRNIHLDPFPPGHVAGLTALLDALLHGTSLVLLERWNADAALELIHGRRVTSSAGTPAQLMALLDVAESDARGVGTLTDYLVGRGPVPPGLLERADRAGVTVCRAYGSVEHPTVTAGTASMPPDKRATTDGRPMPGNEVRIVDAEGGVVRAGQEGEIQTRGPDRFLRYWLPERGEPDLTADGWLRTGDAGRLDAEGFLTVTGRAGSALTRVA
ncbi:class I adenylate-forming enzyme family protein [Streptomyces sp. NPDC088746]|uniref:class I adenylate-forming enzyme family protein n=1 Tax=Streptomyces sp. NPDC088746 TaxID=3365885 RepID=UPI00381D7874